MSAPSNREETIFERALGMASPQTREAYLREACGEDAALRERLTGLLAAHDRAGRFLEHKTPEPAAPSPDARSRRSEEADSLLSPEGPPPHVGGCQSEDVAPLSEKPGDCIGRYKLLEQIGEGGMGTVWMAEQEEPVRRRVALKIIKLGMDTRSVIARFEAERQALALMDHPNIARVFDGGATGVDGAESQDSNLKSQIHSGRPYLVMELVRGLPITKYCEETKMATRERLELLGQVCRAVQHAHQKGIIHRDLKPSNILVTEQDGRPVPKVIDFGIAKATEGRLTEKTLFTGFNQLMGTPAYMSPEQAGLGGLDIDTRSDTYSLGVVLYQLLTGRPPFDTKELLKQGYDAVLRTIREVDPPKPSTRLKQARLSASAESAIRNPQSKIDPDLDWIVMKCLEKDRARRYETANGLAADIERYLHDEPVLARPPSTGYRLRKFGRKHRTAVTAAAGFLLLLATASVLSTALALWANRERGKARESEADTRAVMHFFENRVLAAARPEGQEGGLGRDATIRAAVDAAEADIATAFSKQPLVEASIRDVLGRTYYHLGDFNLAAKQHERALQLRQSLLPADHSDILGAMNHLALAYQALDQFTNAIPLYERALEFLRHQPNPKPGDRVSLMGNLAAAYLKGGRTREALALFQKALDLARSTFPPEHDEVLTAMNNLAEAYRGEGQLREALPLLEEVLRARRKHLPAGHPLTIHSMRMLGTAYQNARLSDDAIKLLREALELSSSKLSSNHVSTLGVMDALGLAYADRGELTNAVALLEEVVKLATNRFSSGHGTTLQAMNNLARIYLAAGWYTNASPLLEEVYLVCTNQFSPTHKIALTVANNLAATYLKLGRIPKALALMEQTLDLRVMHLGPNHKETLTVQNNLSVTYRSIGRLNDALTNAEEVVRRADEQPQQDHPLALWVRNLAICYQDLRRMDDALPLFKRALDLCQTRQSSTHPETLRALYDLANAQQLAGQFSQAESHWSKLLDLQNKLAPEDHATLADTRTHLGRCLLEQEKYTDAEPLFRMNLLYFEKQQPGRSAMFEAQTLLGWSLLGQQNYADAESLLEQGFTGLMRRDAESPSASRRRRLIATAEGIAKLYEKSGSVDKATEWRNRLR